MGGRTAAIFESIGGSYQLKLRHAQDLELAQSLDPALWAALCVPVHALNGNRLFFDALDDDGNGMVRVDELKNAIGWLLAALKDRSVITDGTPELAIAGIATDLPEFSELAAFAAAGGDELSTGGVLKLDKINARLAGLSTGALHGDGALTRAAVADSGAETLFATVAGLNQRAVVTAPELEKFVADARDFLAWAQNAAQPSFRGHSPEADYALYLPLRDKIDEFFRFCDLIALDPANSRRFTLNGEALPVLELTDAAAVESAIAAAPLALPTADGVLHFDGTLNPAYRRQATALAAAWGIHALDRDAWAGIKDEFAPYAEYLAKAQDSAVAALGPATLAELLSGRQVEILRAVFERDSRLGGQVAALKKLQRLLLYKANLLEFANNFVNFDALFDPGRLSLLQAGTLIMDSHRYSLAVWISDVAAHKKIAVQSNLCLLYLELFPGGAAASASALRRYAAVAVTGGTLARIYVGKPAFFIAGDGATYNGRVVDLVIGPISFWQTMFAPFRRLSMALGERLQKITDFSNTEKQLETAIKSGAAPAAAPAPAGGGGLRGFFSGGSVMLLAGGLSVAAIGAAASFVLKSVAGALETLSRVPGLHLLCWIGVIAALFFVPASINTLFKLRKRNLTLFLEAGGWAINLPMRLNVQVSGIFTGSGRYPEHVRFKPALVPQAAVTVPRVRRRHLRRLPLLLLMAALLALAAVYAYRHWRELLPGVDGGTRSSAAAQTATSR